MSARKKPAPLPKRSILDPFEPKVTEVFNVPYISGRDQPTAVNYVSVQRYRVTIERIEEPVEVLRERLLTLCKNTERNMHLSDGFRSIAKDLGIEDFDYYKLAGTNRKER